jgi:hypothetical protein
VKRDSPGERLGALAQELGRGAAEHQKASRRSRPIREHAQRRKEPWAKLYLVEHDEPA